MERPYFARRYPSLAKTQRGVSEALLLGGHPPATAQLTHRTFPGEDSRPIRPRCFSRDADEVSGRRKSTSSAKIPEEVGKNTIDGGCVETGLAAEITEWEFLPRIHSFAKARRRPDRCPADRAKHRRTYIPIVSIGVLPGATAMDRMADKTHKRSVFHIASENAEFAATIQLFRESPALADAAGGGNRETSSIRNNNL